MTNTLKVSQPRRKRADSVLGNRMEETHNYRRIKPSTSSRWSKVRKMIEKDTTKLVLFEVPKGFDIENELIDLNLGDRLRRVAGSNKQRIRRIATKSNKNCLISLETAESEAAKSTDD